MIDHDRLFKELLSTFFIEFLDLFLPEVVGYIEPESITFLDKEVFTDVTEGDKYETDLLVQVRFRNEPSFFLIHVENQATAKADFGKRMFRYFSRLYEKHGYPVYPIVVFSYDKPKAQAPSEFRVDFPDFSVLSFNYRVIQLNQLSWQDFITAQNPVATALMAKMKIEPEDRPKVKAECLRLIVTLRLNPAKAQLISGFVDTYLKLTPEEESTFKIEVGRTAPEEQAQIMEIVTSWMQEGIEKGLKEGIQQGELRIVTRLLTQALGPVPSDIRTKLKALSEPQLDQLCDRLTTLTTLEQLTHWLDDVQQSESAPE